MFSKPENARKMAAKYIKGLTKYAIRAVHSDFLEEGTREELLRRIETC